MIEKEDGFRGNLLHTNLEYGCSEFIYSPFVVAGATLPDASEFNARVSSVREAVKGGFWRAEVVVAASSLGQEAESSANISGRMFLADVLLTKAHTFMQQLGNQIYSLF